MGFDNGSLVVQQSSDDVFSLLVPYVIDTLEFVRVDPCFENVFILLLFIVGYCECSDENIFGEYNDVLIVMCALIVVWPSG